MIVELHLWLPGAAADHQRAWEALSRVRVSVEVAGARLPSLAREGLAMSLATHAAQHGPSYTKGVAELELALERWPGPVWEVASELAAELDAVDAFGAGLRLVAAGAALAARLGLPSTDAAEWEIRNRAARPRGAFHLRALLRAGGLRPRIGLLRRALLPRQAWIENEYAWSRGRTWRVPLAYALHLARAPLWAARALRFRARTPR